MSKDKGEQPLITDFRLGLKLLIIVEDMDKKNLAQSAGLSDSYVTRFLQGSQGFNPQIDSLIALANVFDMYIEDVVRYARTCRVANLHFASGLTQEQPLKDLLYIKDRP